MPEENGDGCFAAERINSKTTRNLLSADIITFFCEPRTAKVYTRRYKVAAQQTQVLACLLRDPFDLCSGKTMGEIVRVLVTHLGHQFGTTSSPDQAVAVCCNRHIYFFTVDVPPMKFLRGLSGLSHGVFATARTAVGSAFRIVPHNDAAREHCLLRQERVSPSRLCSPFSTHHASAPTSWGYVPCSFYSISQTRPDRS